MKIIHCLDHYMPMHMAGTEVYAHSLAGMQKAAGQDVAVLIPHFEFYYPGAFVDQYVYDNIVVHQYMETSSPADRDIVSGKMQPQGLANFEKVLNALQPDVVHFHELTRSIGFRIEHVKAAKRMGARVIITMHLSGYTCNTNNLINHNKLCPGKILITDCSVCSYKTLFKLPATVAGPVTLMGIAFDKIKINKLLPAGKLATLLNMPAAIRRIQRDLHELIKHTDHVVTLTNWYKDILISNGVPASKITVVQQSLTTGKPLPVTDRKVELPIRLVFIGRIQPQKGVHLLIDAIRTLPEGQVQLDIYGKQEDSDYYRDCVSRSNGISFIHWKGAIAREEVVQRLSNYHLLCLCSTFSEMSPLVIQEAFAAGLPVLASHVYGNAEQVQHEKNGLLFNFNSVESLQEQIQMIIANPDLVQQFKQHIQPPRTFENVSAAYLHLYNN